MQILHRYAVDVTNALIAATVLLVSRTARISPSMDAIHSWFLGINADLVSPSDKRNSPRLFGFRYCAAFYSVIRLGKLLSAISKPVGIDSLMHFLNDLCGSSVRWLNRKRLDNMAVLIRIKASAARWDLLKSAKTPGLSYAESTCKSYILSRALPI